MSARDLPEDLMQVVHSNARIWLKLPKSRERATPENSVSFSPAIAWKIRSTVRDHPNEFRARLLRLLEGEGAATAGIVIEVPGVPIEERKVTFSANMTKALLRVITDYPSAFCAQLDACCSFARTYVKEQDEIKNTDNPQ